MIIHYHHIPPLWEKMNNFVFAYSGTYFYNALSWWNETCVNSMLTTILFFWYWYLDHRYRVHVFEFEFKKWVLNYSLSILQFHFIKSRQYLGILRVSLKMANTGCTGDHPKHLLGDDVARNHSSLLRKNRAVWMVKLYACFKTFAQYLIRLSCLNTA